MELVGMVDDLEDIIDIEELKLEISRLLDLLDDSEGIPNAEEN